MPHYRLSFREPRQRLLDISLRFVAPADTPRLLLPAWRPGRYVMQNYAANVREWGGSHRIRKETTHVWRVEARAGEEVEVRYRYYAGVLDGGSSFLDDDELYVNPINFCMLVEGLRGEEHLLTVDVPGHWVIETQMARAGGQTFRARDYDHLVDSPLIAAERMTRHSFDQFHLILRGDEGIDTAQFVEPIRKIAHAQAALFGGFPFREYRFLCHVTNKWHGVEHEESCSITIKRDAPDFEYLLTVASHELFHVWNVERIAPARFKPYEYWHETPTQLLWLMEGMTSYYGQLMLVRSGLWTPERYLADLQKEIETLEGMPAREFLSLSQLSFDSWLAAAPHMHDLANATYSFYNKGQVVSALLDLTIRRATNSETSLDDVMRILWSDHGLTGRGVEEDAMPRIVARVAGVGDFFERYVDGVDPLPYAELFDAAGIAFATSMREGPSLAAKFKMQDGMLFVESVIRGGAGMDAGLLPGDEIVSLGDTRITTEAVLQNALAAVCIGERAKLVIARAGMTKDLSIIAREDPRPVVRLAIERESPLRRQWLRSEA